KFCLVIPLPNELHTSLQDNSRLDPTRSIVKTEVGRIVMDFQTRSAEKRSRAGLERGGLLQSW
ncbi:MAG: hypothetical protein COS87_04160, partial [Chloroflexi bacterium CG07_land_8_20_14_0_80_45_17]